MAAAVAYAAIETEMLREGARYTLYRGQQAAFVVATPNLSTYSTGTPAVRAHYAESLGAKADELATADPLLTPTRVVEELQAVPPPPGDAPLTPDRLLRLAVAAARTAALSSRLELYPRGMVAARAVKLAAGSLVGPKELNVPQIQQRIASRYPHAEAIPGRPRLDELLHEAGIALDWDEHAFDGQGGYRHRSILSEPSPTGSSLGRLSTASQPGEPMSPEAEAAVALEERLSRAVQERRFLLLTVAPRYLLRAEVEIVRRFPVLRISLEALLIQEMKATAAALGAKWEVVVMADAAAPDSTDWRRLQTLVRQAMPAVERTLFSADRPVLLVYPGLLARYDQVQLFEKLREACVRTTDAPGFIILIPADAQHHMPVMDGKPIPVILASEWARIPEAWLVNADRAQNSTDVENKASHIGS